MNTAAAAAPRRRPEIRGRLLRWSRCWALVFADIGPSIYCFHGILHSKLETWSTLSKFTA